MANEGNRDIVLAPGEYAYVLDTTKGLVNTIVGPNKVSMSNTDQPVVWEKKSFKRVTADQAIQLNAIAPEGFYIALYNPAREDKHPNTGSISTGADLQVGERVNVHGPANFALYPGQRAEVIRGHHLRSNQYLRAEVYNDAAATRNWKDAVLKPANAGETPADAPNGRQFTLGQNLIIKGTDVAFFMPPTGIKVVADGAQFVRDAVTLERLEYCILLNENGSKRYVQGPAVVFPEPTETFIEKAADGQPPSRKFRAIELNETSGLYVKVIADYKDEDGTEHKTGEEMFITGREQAIYFQREEHSIIRYGEQTKHYAVAVPAGEGRYVLNRLTGDVGLRVGPQMLLCDPRKEVFTRRILSESTLRLWYPGNEKVIAVNKAFEAEEAEVAKIRTHEAQKSLLRTASIQNAAFYADSSSNQSIGMTSRTVAGDQFNRGTSYTPPRTITLDTKYEGAVAISVWTNYAVLVISKRGTRRIVEGPEHILLAYDETLAQLELSTGKPKDDAKLFKTVYLRIRNNKVSDAITVDTQDLAPVELQLAYRVNFEGDSGKWFEVENYVKLLTDHLRSRLRNVAKRTGVVELFNDPVNIIRDSVLGKPNEAGERPGLLFTENDMRVTDVEVLGVTIKQPDIAALLTSAQKSKLTNEVQAATKAHSLDILRATSELDKAKAAIEAAVARELASSEQTRIRAASETELAKIAAELAELEQTRIQTEATLAEQRLKDEADLTKARERAELIIQQAEAETAQIIKRASAANGELAKAITAAADNQLSAKIVETIAPIAAMQGVSAADYLAKMFKGTSVAGALEALASRSSLPVLQDK